MILLLLQLKNLQGIIVFVSSKVEIPGMGDILGSILIVVDMETVGLVIETLSALCSFVHIV